MIPSLSVNPSLSGWVCLKTSGTSVPASSHFPRLMYFYSLKLCCSVSVLHLSSDFPTYPNHLIPTFTCPHVSHSPITPSVYTAYQPIFPSQGNQILNISLCLLAPFPCLIPVNLWLLCCFCLAFACKPMYLHFTVDITELFLSAWLSAFPVLFLAASFTLWQIFKPKLWSMNLLVPHRNMICSSGCTFCKLWNKWLCR